MRMSHAQMYDRLLASDAAYNGRFFTGVLTTGIYCLPSCGARKPKPENVRFFPTCEAARAAGLRPCRKCHPDDFARGADPVLADLETLVAEVRAAPARFPDAAAIVRRSGFGATRLFELFRLHYHTTPADLLLSARLQRARQLLQSPDADAGRPLLDLAAEVGFQSMSTLHEQFRRTHGLTPAAYRELRDASRFEVALPPGYPLAYLRRMLGRDPHSLSERLEGDRYSAVVRLRSGPRLLQLELSPDAIGVELPGSRPPSGAAFEAHAVVAGLLGLEQDTAGFVRLARRLGFARLVAGRPELRLTQTPTVFDGLLWSILGQQINLGFACLLRRRLTERAGAPLPGNTGLWIPPDAARLAALSPRDLLGLQLSRQKADYLLGVSRLVASGEFDPESLRFASATRAERTLLALRGLGPWSVHYVLMRALGFADCVPVGDTGVTSGLRALFRLEEKPDADAVRALMSVFSPYRSLATAHLWQFDRPAP